MNKTELLALSTELQRIASGSNILLASNCLAIEAAAALIREIAQQEPVAWMHPVANVFAKHRDGAANFGCTIPLYTHPLPALKPLTERRRMQIIGDEFPLALVEPIVIQKIDTVCLAIEAAHGIKEKP